MSLDVYLTLDEPSPKSKGSGIFVRQDGATTEISREEWGAKFPGREPIALPQSEDGWDGNVYSSNITHNLGKMANEAGIYKHLWRPDEIGITDAIDLIAPLDCGLALLKAKPEHFRQFNAPNGWGLYEHLVKFVSEYLTACKDNPKAKVRVSR